MTSYNLGVAGCTQKILKNPKLPLHVYKNFFTFLKNDSLRSASLLPYSLHQFLSSVHSALSLFFISLRSVRFGEGEGIGVQRCGGRRWHTRYAFALVVRSGVHEVCICKAYEVCICNLITDQLDMRINFKDTDQLDTCGTS